MAVNNTKQHNAVVRGRPHAGGRERVRYLHQPRPAPTDKDTVYWREGARTLPIPVEVQIELIEQRLEFLNTKQRDAAVNERRPSARGRRRIRGLH